MFVPPFDHRTVYKDCFSVLYLRMKFVRVTLSSIKRVWICIDGKLLAFCICVGTQLTFNVKVSK